MRRYGEEGRRLWRGSRAASTAARSAPSARPKACRRKRPSTHDIADFRSLERILWSLTEEVSARLKSKELAGATVTLKLKTADFKIRTRARSLDAPTQLARRIFAAARDLLEHEIDGTRLSPARRRRQRTRFGATKPTPPTSRRPRRRCRTRRRQRARPLRRGRRGQRARLRGAGEDLAMRLRMMPVSPLTRWIGTDRC